MLKPPAFVEIKNIPPSGSIPTQKWDHMANDGSSAPGVEDGVSVAKELWNQ